MTVFTREAPEVELELADGALALLWLSEPDATTGRQAVHLSIHTSDDDPGRHPLLVTVDGHERYVDGLHTVLRIDYQYRDADNYKAHDCFYVTADGLTDTDRARLLARLSATLDDGEYFVPADVDLEPLQWKLTGYSDGYTDADHPWHELHLDSHKVLDQAPHGTGELLTLEQLVSRFETAAAAGWPGQHTPLDEGETNGS